MTENLIESFFKIKEMAAAKASNAREFITIHPELYDLYFSPTRKADKNSKEQKEFQSLIDEYFELYPEDLANNPNKSKTTGFIDCVHPILHRMKKEKEGITPKKEAPKKEIKKAAKADVSIADAQEQLLNLTSTLIDLKLYNGKIKEALLDVGILLEDADEESAIADFLM